MAKQTTPAATKPRKPKPAKAEVPTLQVEVAGCTEAEILGWLSEAVRGGEEVALLFQRALLGALAMYRASDKGLGILSKVARAIVANGQRQPLELYLSHAAPNVVLAAHGAVSQSEDSKRRTVTATAAAPYLATKKQLVSEYQVKALAAPEQTEEDKAKAAAERRAKSVKTLGKAYHDAKVPLKQAIAELTAAYKAAEE